MTTGGIEHTTSNITHSTEDHCASQLFITKQNMCAKWHRTVAIAENGI